MEITGSLYFELLNNVYFVCKIVGSHIKIRLLTTQETLEY